MRTLIRTLFCLTVLGAFAGCTSECPPGENPGSLFCNRPDMGPPPADTGPPPDAGDPCATLQPGDPCGVGLVCSVQRRCTCGNGTMQAGEECDNGRMNGAGTGCESSCVYSCSATRPCTASSNPCRTNDRCDMVTHRCSDGMSVAAGTMCGTDAVCNGMGSCVSCANAGSTCMPSTACRTGTLSCATGIPTCEATGNLPPGSSCGNGQVCSPTGDCVACAAGMTCMASQPCLSGSIDCATGAPVCTDGAPFGPGTACGANRVCGPGGTCVDCTMGAACQPTNPCFNGTTSCTTGAPICLDAAPKDPGTVCGTDRVCDGSGGCVACQQGAACTPTNDCFVGRIECSSGSPVCMQTTMRAADSACITGGGRVCSASGTCVECNAATDCPTSGVRDGTCIDNTTCRGERGARTCVNSQCGVNNGLRDDSFCTMMTLANDCGFYRPVFCNGAAMQSPPACPTMCTTDADCDAGAHCNDARECVPDLTPGDTCTMPRDCGAGLTCADGVCCTSACNGSCEACNLPATRGTCAAVPAGQDPASECGAVDCSGYFSGWTAANSDQCFTKGTIPDNQVSCNGARACENAAARCPGFTTLGALQADCNDACQRPAGGTCGGMTAGVCTNVAGSPPTFTCGVGACLRSAPTCVNGAPSSACAPGAPQTEICGNGMDDNCNGAIDASRPNADACPVCGNGYIESGEACDWGGGPADQGCSSDCRSIQCSEGGVNRQAIGPDGITCYWRRGTGGDGSRDAGEGYCNGRRANLVRMETAGERDWVFNNMVFPPGSGSRCWVGARHRSGARYDYTWDGSGVMIPVSDWRGGEPNGYDDCVQTSGSGQTYDDAGCGNSRDWICERPRQGIP